MSNQKLTARQVIKQIGWREYYEAINAGTIAYFKHGNRRKYHEQWQVDEYIAREKAKALVPARVEQPRRPSGIRKGVLKIINNPNL